MCEVSLAALSALLRISLTGRLTWYGKAFLVFENIRHALPGDHGNGWTDEVRLSEIVIISDFLRREYLEILLRSGERVQRVHALRAIIAWVSSSQELVHDTALCDIERRAGSLESGKKSAPRIISVNMTKEHTRSSSDWQGCNPRYKICHPVQVRQHRQEQQWQW